MNTATALGVSAAGNRAEDKALVRKLQGLDGKEVTAKGKLEQMPEDVGASVPPLGMLVHALEHGRVEIQYRTGTPAQRQKQLETLLAEPIAGQPVGFDQLVFENDTGMPYAIAATAWQHRLACPTFDDRVFDALRAFPGAA